MLKMAGNLIFSNYISLPFLTYSVFCMNKLESTRINEIWVLTIIKIRLISPKVATIQSFH